MAYLEDAGRPLWYGQLGLDVIVKLLRQGHELLLGPQGWCWLQQRMPQSAKGVLNVRSQASSCMYLSRSDGASDGGLVDVCIAVQGPVKGALGLLRARADLPYSRRGRVAPVLSACSVCCGDWQKDRARMPQSAGLKAGLTDPTW